MMTICKCSLQYSLHFASTGIDVGHCNSDSENLEKKNEMIVMLSISFTFKEPSVYTTDT